MKKLLVVGLLAVCSEAHAEQVKSVFDPETVAASCKSAKATDNYFSCFAKHYDTSRSLLAVQISLVEMMLKVPRADIPAIAREAENASVNLAGSLAVNRAFVPFLRAEMQNSPVALALLPKLHAAFAVAISGMNVVSGETENTYRQRQVLTNAAMVSLLKEVEFSQ